MAADGTADDAVRAYQHVHVELRIYLQGAQDYNIQGVGGASEVLARGILHSRNLLVVRIVLDGLRRHFVKGLHVDELADESFLVQFHHVGGDAAEGEGSLDTAVDHFLTDVLDGSKGSTAGTGLDAEAILKVTGVNDHFGSLFGKEDIAGILGIADGAGSNLGAVSYAFHHYHALYVGGRDGLGHVGIFHEVVGEHHHVLGITGIGQGVTQRAADALGVFAAGEAAGVAQFIGR